MMTLGFALGAFVVLLILLTKAGFRVEEGSLAVVTYFGAAERDPSDAKRLRTRPPGLAWKWPWGKVHIVSMKEQSLQLAGKDSGRMAMAEDGTVLRFDSILRYSPIESELERFLFGLKDATGHVTGLFTCLLRNEIANFRSPKVDVLVPVARPSVDMNAGSYALIRRERDSLNRRIEEFSKKQIGERYGVAFSAVDLTDILPPDELAEALNGVMDAKADVEAAYFRAEGENTQRVLAAERGVDIAKSRALAVETEITTLGRYLQELSKSGVLHEYLDRRRSEVLSASKTLYMRENS